MDSVVGRHHVHASSSCALSFPEIHHRREVQVGIDDLVALTGKIEAGGDNRLALRHILMKRDGVGIAIHQSFDESPNFVPKHPPGFFPSAHSARCPNFGVLVQSPLRCPRHSSQRITDQISGIRQDGKLRTEAEKVIGHEEHFSLSAAEGNGVIGPLGILCHSERGEESLSPPMPFRPTSSTQ